MKICFIILFLLFLNIRAEEKAEKKSVIVAKVLTLAVPFGGLGYAYADEWKSEYGYTWLATESSVFTLGVGLAAVSNFYGNQGGTTDVAFLIKPNIYGYSSIPFFLLWAIYRIYQIEDVERLIEVKNNTLSLSFRF